MLCVAATWGHPRFSRAPASPLASKLMRNTSKITAVDQPNNRTPFMAIRPKHGPMFDRRHVAVAECRAVYKSEVQEICAFRPDDAERGKT